jgi:hypothetical protein
MASSCPLSQKRVVVSMAHRWLRRRRYTIVGLERLEIVEGDLNGRTAIAVELHDHPFVSGLKVILGEVRAAAARGTKLVVVRMESAWLAKALIQYDRAVRSIEVGQLVTDLHTEAVKLGAVVLIAGPVKAAPAVGTAIRQQLLRAEYQEAVDRAARDGVFQRAAGGGSAMKKQADRIVAAFHPRSTADQDIHRAISAGAGRLAEITPGTDDENPSTTRSSEA